MSPPVSRSAEDLVPISEEAPESGDRKLRDPKAPIDWGQVRSWAEDAEIFRRVAQVGPGQLGIVVEQDSDRTSLHLVATFPGSLILHWGIVREGRWHAPPLETLPEGSHLHGDAAAQSPFRTERGYRRLDVVLPTTNRNEASQSVGALLLRPDCGEWLRDGHGDFHIPLRPPPAKAVAQGGGSKALAARIIDRETNASSWTLMHRFDLASELVAEAADRTDELALIFVWLRFSELRQLDWQRRYNTQPRRLTHAQERLGERIAELYRSPQSRAWARRLIGTVGRGGPGQRVRDGILEIMHRHHLKEQSGTFIEQWHQKLHNNTTPDDVVICDAYLAFLRSGGDVARFYQVAEECGVSRERLAGYDRPITVEPALPGGDTGALVRDFEAYGQLLRAVHDSADLQASVETLRGLVPPELQIELEGLLSAPPLPRLPPRPRLAAVERQGEISANRNSAAEVLLDQTKDVVSLARDRIDHVVRAQETLSTLLENTDDRRVLRDLLYLDRALAEDLRKTLEGLRGATIELNQLVFLLEPVLRSLLATSSHEELSVCHAQWQVLIGRLDSEDRDWVLHARSVIDRVSRWAAESSVGMVKILDPIARDLGSAFQAEPWTIEMFAEEVVRGGPLFALSILVRDLERALRELAGVGPWQIVSPGEGAGIVRRVERLIELEGRELEEDTVVLAAQAGGEEDIPARVHAVITISDIDLLSHLAVRARNAHTMVACLGDWQLFDELAKRVGEIVTVRATSAGDVVVETGTQQHPVEPQVLRSDAVQLSPVSQYGGVVPFDEFVGDRVGGKSRVLAELRNSLPPNVEVPASVTMAFGAFDRTLEDERNESQRTQLERLGAVLKNVGDPRGALAEIRQVVCSLMAPPELLDELAGALTREHLPHESGLTPIWDAIVGVWASRWTDRAYFARRSRRVPEEGVRMAVLVQAVVPAEWSFVLHTVNPLTGDANELYGELAVGLGEALVGNYPGRPLGFVAHKETRAVRIQTYPSKSTALHSSGLICRSDSNAEDLEGFAGAGLHDSLTTASSERRLIDYAAEDLLWDEKRRTGLLQRLLDLGMSIEAQRHTPQDIEGALVGDNLYVLQSRPQVGL